MGGKVPEFFLGWREADIQEPRWLDPSVKPLLGAGVTAAAGEAGTVGYTWD